MRFTYGKEYPEQPYPQYREAESGDTLVARPGETYDIEQAAGLTAPGEPGEDGTPGEPVTIELPMPPDDRWKPAKAQNRASASTETETSR